MEDFRISQDIYEEALDMKPLHISDEIYSVAVCLTKESLLQELSASYKFSGRYWIWKIGNGIYRDKWQKMLRDNEMQFTAKGFKYFLSYPDLASLQHEFFMRNSSGRKHSATPAAYFAFSHYLRRGDVVMVVGRKQEVVAWGTVEGPYMYRPTRDYGPHYRKVSWNKANLPYLFTDKNEVLFQVANEETAHLEDTLIGNLVLDRSLLPFEFVRKEEKASLKYDGFYPADYLVEGDMNLEKKQRLGEIIGALKKVVE